MTRKASSSCISSKIDSGVQPRAPTSGLSLSLSLSSLSSVRPSSIHHLLLPHTLLPLLLHLTSAYYIRRRTLPPLKNQARWTFGSAIDLSVSLRDPTANIHDKKSTTSIPCTRPSTDLSESPHSFVQTTLKFLLADLLENLALSFSPVSTATSKCVVFFPTVCYQTAEATNSPLLKVRAYIGIIVILLTNSFTGNNPAIDA